LCVTTEIKRKKTGAEFKKIKLQRTGQQLIFQTESVRVRNSYALEKALERERETTKPSKQLPRRYNKSKKKKIGGRKGKRFPSCNIMRNMTNHDTLALLPRTIAIS
jgi:hypothetical protein